MSDSWLKIPTKTINDAVELIHCSLTGDETYRAYLRATYDSLSVTGYLVFDDCKAAEMIQIKAFELGLEQVCESKLSEIHRALQVVLRRYGMSRKERRKRGCGDIQGEGFVMS